MTCPAVCVKLLSFLRLVPGSKLAEIPSRGEHCGQCFQDSAGSRIIDLSQHFDQPFFIHRNIIRSQAELTD